MQYLEDFQKAQHLPNKHRPISSIKIKDCLKLAGIENQNFSGHS